MIKLLFTVMFTAEGAQLKSILSAGPAGLVISHKKKKFLSTKFKFQKIIKMWSSSS